MSQHGIRLGDQGGGEGKTYRIAWKHEGRDRVVRGEGSYRGVTEAQWIAAETNRLYPEVNHWVEEI